MAVDLTRRDLIARGAAAAGALMTGSLLAPRLAFAGAAGEAVWEMRLPRTRIVEPRHAFELLAVEVPAGAHAELRARGLDGRWSDWLPLHRADDHGPDRGGTSTLSDPIWTGPARAFELRATRPLHGARVVLVDPGNPLRAAAAARHVEAGLPAGGGQPAIIARSTWATASCKPRVPAVYGSVNLGFVHHTVSSNFYRPSQSAAMVRSICLFHKYGNGWNDIGYNFVVDRYGQIFEGRAGGIDDAIEGAHAGGYNFASTGVALLGDFTGGGPPKKAFDSLTRLLSWKLAIHGVQVPGTTVVQVSRDGAAYSRYRAGAHVQLNRIAGHRDGDTTACPGAGMYRQLPRLRQAVARRIGTVSSISASLQGASPGSATVGGLLTSAGQPIAGATVEIQRHSTTHAAAPLGTATTNADGTWSAAVPLPASAQLRAIFRGDPLHSAAVSPNLVALVPPQISLTAATQLTTPGGVIEFDGAVTPRKPRVSLTIAQQQPDGSLTTVRTIRLKPANDGSFTRTIGFPNPGQYQVIAHTAADDANALGTSAPVAITVG